MHFHKWEIYVEGITYYRICKKCGKVQEFTWDSWKTVNKCRTNSWKLKYLQDLTDDENLSQVNRRFKYACTEFNKFMNNYEVM